MMASWTETDTVACLCTGSATIVPCRSLVQRRNFTRNGACYADCATKGGRQDGSGSIKTSSTSAPARQSTWLKCFFEKLLFWALFPSAIAHCSCSKRSHRRHCGGQRT